MLLDQGQASQSKVRESKPRLYNSQVESVKLWKLPNVSGVQITKVDPGFTEKFLAILGISYTRRNLKFLPASGGNKQRARYLQHMHLELLKSRVLY